MCAVRAEQDHGGQKFARATNVFAERQTDNYFQARRLPAWYVRRLAFLPQRYELFFCQWLLHPYERTGSELHRTLQATDNGDVFDHVQYDERPMALAHRLGGVTSGRGSMYHSMYRVPYPCLLNRM